MALRRLFYSFGAVEENALSPRVESIFLQHNLLMISLSIHLVDSLGLLRLQYNQMLCHVLLENGNEQNLEFDKVLNW